MRDENKATIAAAQAVVEEKQKIVDELNITITGIHLRQTSDDAAAEQEIAKTRRTHWDMQTWSDSEWRDHARRHQAAGPEEAGPAGAPAAAAAAPY